MRLEDCLNSEAFETWSDEIRVRPYPKKNSTWKKGSFYDSVAWKEIRIKVLHTYGRECMKCKKRKGILEVDHIKPGFYYPELSLEFNNLQVLCHDCNQDKGIDTVDYRPTDRP